MSGNARRMFRCLALPTVAPLEDGLPPACGRPREFDPPPLQLRAKATSGRERIKIESNASHSAPISVDEV